jgi:hypothetical protein
LLDAGFWILVAGFWLLDAGYWLLDKGKNNETDAVRGKRRNSNKMSLTLNVGADFDELSRVASCRD